MGFSGIERIQFNCMRLQRRLAMTHIIISREIAKQARNDTSVRKLPFVHNKIKGLRFYLTFLQFLPIF